MKKTRRFTALLCVLCMLFTSIPSSVLSDPAPATPTDLGPLPEVQQETPAEAPQADETLSVDEDETVTGALDEDGNDYLIRFTPEQDRTLCLILEADAAVEASVTDEKTGNTAQLTAEGAEGENTLVLQALKAKQDNDYLVRISGGEKTAFSLRIVRKSILEAETDGAAGQEEPGEEPAEEPGEEPGEEPAEKPAEKPAEEPGDEPGGEPGDEPGDEPETEQPKPAGPEADREVTAGDDTTVTGELDGTDYLVRFTPDMDRTLILLLTSPRWRHAPRGASSSPRATAPPPRRRTSSSGRCGSARARATPSFRSSATTRASATERARCARR